MELNTNRFICLFLIWSLFGCGCMSSRGAREGIPPFLLAAREGDIRKLERCLSNAEDVNQTSKYGWTALMFAAWKGREKDAIITLLEK